jgi:carboxyl-terminal processing protease
MDAALAKLQAQGMKSLIWDVRGNPGGLLTAAVEVLDRFLASGVLVSTKGRIQDQNWSYSARPQGTTQIPLVLLVDHDSASASEIVAGAILDHNRGTIVGRQTYGKWSVQSIFPVQGSTGLRLTTAKFYSPRGNTYGKVGVKRHVVVDRPAGEHFAFYGGSDQELAQDEDVRKGLEILERQASR